jgi:hypothetical protein
MIPRSRSPRPATATDKDKPAPETEQIEVTDLALMFEGGHVLPLTIFPGDEFFTAADSPRMSVKLASGELTIIHKDKILYETSRKRTITRVKKATTPAA